MTGGYDGWCKLQNNKRDKLTVPPLFDHDSVSTLIIQNVDHRLPNGKKDR